MSVHWNPRPRDELLRELQLPEAGAAISRESAQSLAELIALRGLGRVAPNPLVGAVLVDTEHRFIAAGAHQRLGGPHAEIEALTAAAAKNAAGMRGGTLYVTLEPCAHQNRTPPCAPAVAHAGIAHVVYGAVDPNPAVNGRGVAQLGAAGVTATIDAGWRPRCEALAEVFFHHVRTHRPFVALKTATGLDGAMARPGDRRAWITGPRARAFGHFLRLRYDAVLVGQGTLLADDPTLDARDALVPGRPPLRVVLDPDGAALAARAPQAWRLVAVAPERILWITAPGAAASPAARALRDLGANVLALAPEGNGAYAPAVLLDALAARDVTSVLLEGGAGLYGSFLAAGAVDRLHLFQAARLFGAGALTWTHGAGPLTLTAASAIEITPLGDDWVVETKLGGSF